MGNAASLCCFPCPPFSCRGRTLAAQVIPKHSPITVRVQPGSGANLVQQIIHPHRSDEDSAFVSDGESAFVVTESSGQSSTHADAQLQDKSQSSLIDDGGFIMFSAIDAAARRLESPQSKSSLIDDGGFIMFSAIDAAARRLESSQETNLAKTKIDFISELPPEIGLYIMTLLMPNDAIRAGQVSHYWRLLAGDHRLWEQNCREVGLCPQMAMLSLIGGPCWKPTFLHHLDVYKNWGERPLRPERELLCHSGHMITVLKLEHGRILTASTDKTLIVWSVASGAQIVKFQGHTGGVWAAEIEDNILVSGSCDKTVKVWDATTGICSLTLLGHSSTVRCLALYENRVVSGSRDTTLRLWDTENGNLLHIFSGHHDSVRCVVFDGHIIASGSYDHEIRIWDPMTGLCLHQLQGHTDRVSCLKFNGTNLISASSDKTIRIWDTETGTCKKILTGHRHETAEIDISRGLILSGNADSTSKLWDVASGQCLLTTSGPRGHSHPVTSVQILQKFIVTASHDGSVKLWDKRNGAFVRNLVQLSGSAGVVWKIRASESTLVCAVGCRNGTEPTKLIVMDFGAGVTGIGL